MAHVKIDLACALDAATKAPELTDGRAFSVTTRTAGKAIARIGGPKSPLNTFTAILFGGLAARLIQD